MVATTDVRVATRADEATVVGVITLAFSGDPMARWAFPDPARYLAVMPVLASAFGGNGFAHDAAHLVDGRCCAIRGDTGAVAGRLTPAHTTARSGGHRDSVRSPANRRASNV
jgi:hypothetical protein